MVSEGQASGSVVAGYASGAIPEVGGEAAALVPEGDARALEELVLRILEDPAEYAERRRAGLVRSSSRTWDAVALEQLAFYEQALAATTTAARQARPDALRADAAREFGPPAHTNGDARPFALPLLRRPSALSNHLGRLIDFGARLRADAARRRL